MADTPVRTRVQADGRWWPFQEFMIRRGGEGPIEDVDLPGIEEAVPPPEALEAIASACAIVLGPSNPVISIAPILAVPGMAEAIDASPAPAVAVSPIVGAEVLKGPTAAFLAWAGHTLDAQGIDEAYRGVIDGIVTDEDVELPLPALRTDTLMAGAEGRARLARETLDFALALASTA